MISSSSKSLATVLVLALTLSACSKSSNSDGNGGGSGDGAGSTIGQLSNPLTGKSAGVTFTIGSARADALAGGYVSIVVFEEELADPCRQMGTPRVTIGPVLASNGTPAMVPLVVYSEAGRTDRAPQVSYLGTSNGRVQISVTSNLNADNNVSGVIEAELCN